MGTPRAARHEATPGIDDYRRRMIEQDQNRPIREPLVLPAACFLPRRAQR